MRIFVFVLAATLAGCGSSNSTVTDAPASTGPVATAPQSLSGRWEGPGVSLLLNESHGVVQGMGSVRLGMGTASRAGDSVPVEVTGGLLPDGRLFSVLLPQDETLETDNLGAKGQLAEGVLHLSVGGAPSVELRPAAEPPNLVTRYQVSAPPYTINIDLGGEWSSSPGLVEDFHGGIIRTSVEGGVRTVYLLNGIMMGRLIFPDQGGALQSPSYVANQQGQVEYLTGQATAGYTSVAPGAVRETVATDVGGVWSGPDFVLDVTQSESLLSAAGLYRGVLVRGAGTTGNGTAVVFLNTLFGNQGVDGVTLVRHPDGRYTVTDSARGTTQSSKLWDDNLQTTGDSYSINTGTLPTPLLVDITGANTTRFTGTWRPDYGPNPIPGPTPHESSGNVVAHDKQGVSAANLYFGNTTVVLAQFSWPQITSGVSGTTVGLTNSEYLHERLSGSVTLTKP